MSEEVPNGKRTTPTDTATETHVAEPAETNPTEVPSPASENKKDKSKNTAPKKAAAPKKPTSAEKQPSVKTVRSQAVESVNAATNTQKMTPPPPRTFPKVSLEDSIVVPKAIEEKNGGNPMAADLLVTAVGYKKTSDWRFLDLLRSANQYGLVSGSGQTATVTIENIGRDVVTPASPQERQKALLLAFRNVDDFKKVETFYGTKRIPEDEYFLNTLTRQFGIPKDRASEFAEVFRSNLAFLRSFNIDTSATVAAGDDRSSQVVGANLPKSGGIQDARVREFLDTCFVMMPFGGWFDRYYQEVYVPAIKDAGLEPVRADELFSTGSVVEQIWEQITKAKVLLADLTDKNANVFYELGLAHAAIKPVVFTSARVDDVPFDLRHLRVIIYEVRETDWAPKLRKHITDYLRNTIKEPSKSIPHPFRGLREKQQQEIEPGSVE